MSIIHSDPAEAVAIRYYEKLNSSLGSLTIGVAFSIASLNLTQNLAWLFIFVSLLWGMFQGKEYRKLRKCRPNYKPSFSLFFEKSLIFIVGYLMLSLIAAGFWVN